MRNGIAVQDPDRRYKGVWTAKAWKVGVDDEVDKLDRRESSLTVGGRAPERMVSVSSRSRGPVPR